MTGISSFTYRRVSTTATWSFRERAVCRRLPASPMRWVSRVSMFMWMSSLSTEELHLVRLDVRQDGLQALHNLLHLVLPNDPLLAQHLGMGDGSGDVLLVQPGVKLDGGVKIIDQCIGLLLKPASP